MRQLRENSGLVQQLFKSYLQQFDRLAIGHYIHLIIKSQCITLPVTESSVSKNVFPQSITFKLKKQNKMIFMIIIT